jgi:hypothetical protein
MMITYQHIQALNQAIKEGMFLPDKHTKIIFLNHKKLAYSIANITVPVHWRQVGLAWLGEGGSILFIDPDLEPDFA